MDVAKRLAKSEIVYWLCVVILPPIALVLAILNRNNENRGLYRKVKIAANVWCVLMTMLFVFNIKNKLRHIGDEPSSLVAVQTPVLDNETLEQTESAQPDFNSDEIDEPAVEPVSEFAAILAEHPEYAVYRDYPLDRTDKQYDNYDSILNIEIYEVSHNILECRQNFVLWQSNGTDRSREEWGNYFDKAMDNNFHYVYVKFNVTFIQNYKDGDDLFSLKPKMFGLIVEGDDKPVYERYNSDFKTILSSDPDSLTGNSVTCALIFEYYDTEDSNVYMTFGENRYDLTADYSH